MAISNASRSDSRVAAGSICASRTTRSVSCALSAKCLIVEMMWRLCTPSIMAARHHSGEQRVLGEIFKIAAAARVANEIRRAAKKHIEALRARFGADGLALKPRHARVPGRGESEIGRHRRRRVAGTDIARVGDAEFCVRLLQRGNAEARYRRARNPPSRSIHRAWACRPTAPRSRHGPATASPARSSDRAPFARAGREAGRRRSTATLVGRGHAGRGQKTEEDGREDAPQLHPLADQIRPFACETAP